jgi:hypothetical protein
MEEYMDADEISEMHNAENEDAEGLSLSKTKNLFDGNYDSVTENEITNKNAIEEFEGEKTFDGPDFRLQEVKEQENQDVIRYQKTGDLAILEKLYIDRVPTLNYWANKNRYLDDYNSEDIRSALTKKFLSLVDQYKRTTREVVDGKVKVIKRNFNSYLFQSFRHEIINIGNRKKAKKRTPYPTDDSTCAKLLSLDYTYSSNGSDKVNLRDTIADEKNPDAVKNVVLDEMIEIISKDEPPHVREFFEAVSMGKKVSALLRDYKTFENKMRVKSDLAERIKKSRRPCTRIVTELVEKRVPERFKLIDYSIEGCTITYRIEMHKTKETDDISRKMRKLKKHKDRYLSKIGIYEKKRPF